MARTADEMLAEMRRRCLTFDLSAAYQKFVGDANHNYHKGYNAHDVDIAMDAYRYMYNAVSGTNYLIQQEGRTDTMANRYALPSSTVNAADFEVAKELEKRKQQRLVEQKLALIEAYGEDTFDEGIVLHFKKRFEKDGILYQYAALKADGRWHTTGKKNFGAGTWEQFVLALVSGEFPVRFDNIQFCGPQDHEDYDLQKTIENVNALTEDTQIVPQHTTREHEVDPREQNGNAQPWPPFGTSSYSDEDKGYDGHPGA